jgi:Fur family transcriptional regulator, peroxide stress response regulator
VQKAPNSPGIFMRLCREAGLKATHQRIEIYRTLAATDEHPDAESIYRRARKRIPSISFDTVYRTLRTLDEKGLIARVGLAMERQRFDANGRKHHHFVCEKCGLVRDFYSPRFDRLAAPDESRKLGVPQSVHVEIRGVCHVCKAKDARGSRRLG